MTLAKHSTWAPALSKRLVFWLPFFANCHKPNTFDYLISQISTPPIYNRYLFSWISTHPSYNHYLISRISTPPIYNRYLFSWISTPPSHNVPPGGRGVEFNGTPAENKPMHQNDYFLFGALSPVFFFKWLLQPRTWNIRILKTAFILNAHAAKWVAHASDFRFFSRFSY